MIRNEFSDAFPPHDGGGLDDLILLPANGKPETFDVGETDAQLELAAADGEAPYVLRVTHADGTPLHTASVTPEFFGPGVTRDRFATVAGRRLAGVANVDADAATEALTDALEDIRARFAADEVHIVDEEARELVEKTAAVSYSPNDGADLVVAFADVDFTGNNFSYHRSVMTIPARQWADTASAPDLPRVQGIQRALNGSAGRDRWRTVRRVWMAMADTDGDAPPAEIPLSADDLRERGTVPKIGVSVDEIRDAVRENRRFDAVREELGVSRSRESILQGALEKLDLDSDVKYGMVSP